jgi:hypothetical protein
MPATIEDTWGGGSWNGREYLSLVLDIHSNLQDQVPLIVTNEAIYVDLASLENSVGKVADNDIFIHPDYDDQEQSLSISLHCRKLYGLLYSICCGQF